MDVGTRLILMINNDSFTPSSGILIPEPVQYGMRKNDALSDRHI